MAQSELEEQWEKGKRTTKMRLTLLEIVQVILNDMDSDNVNSISDTVEAQQVAVIVRDAYMNMANNRNWHNQQQLFQLLGLGDKRKPNYLAAPGGLKELVLFKYNKKRKDVDKGRDVWKEVKYISPEEFLEYCSRRNSAYDNVEIIEDFGGTPLLIMSNKAPEFWTTFDDKYIVCDSWDKGEEDTLHASNTQCLGYIFKDFEMDDDAYPPIPDEAFPALIQYAKAQAFSTLKQVDNQLAATEFSRQSTWLSRKNWKLHGGLNYPNYGRRRIK